jgi:hypothetical protein
MGIIRMMRLVSICSYSSGNLVSLVVASIHGVLTETVT